MEHMLLHLQSEDLRCSLGMVEDEVTPLNARVHNEASRSALCQH